MRVVHHTHFVAISEAVPNRRCVEPAHSNFRQGLSEGFKAFETGKKAFIAAASNDADAKKGGRRGKPARGGKAGALDAPEKTVTWMIVFICVVSCIG